MVYGFYYHIEVWKIPYYINSDGKLIAKGLLYKERLQYGYGYSDSHKLGDSGSYSSNEGANYVPDQDLTFTLELDP